MALTPLNDVIKVEVETDEFGFGNPNDQEGVEKGIVVDFPELTPYFGFHSFAFEDSYNSDENRFVMDEYRNLLMGKRVYWKGYSERGMVIKEGDKRYAFIKLTDLIAYSDADEDAVNISANEYKV